MPTLVLSLALVSPVRAQAEGLSAPPPSMVSVQSETPFVLPGHHIEERRRTGLLVTGMSMFGGSYGTSVLLGAESIVDQPGAWSLFVPVFGPLMYAGLHDSEPCGGSIVCVDPLVPFISVALGLLQAVGALLVAVGLPTDEVVVPDDIGSVALDLGLDVTSDGASASLTGAF